MQYEPSFPITASVPWIIGVFFCSLVIFHVAFVRVLKLRAVTWKKLDYVWLGIAALGLLGAASEVRRTAAADQLSNQRSILNWAYDDLRREVGFMSGAAVCRHFVRTDYSGADFDAMQREYDAVCEFAKQLSTRLPAEPPPDLEALRLGDRPKTTDVILRYVFAGLDRESGSYLHARRALDQTVAASQRTVGEKTLGVLGPLLLAIALALRITKVSGEIRLQA